MVPLIFQFFPEKCHGPVEVMKGKTIHPIDDMVPVPRITEPVGA
jgi:hypothetical protein